MCDTLTHHSITPMLSLNQNELETLRILWERGECKPAEIEALFSWPIENATLRSVLVNLVRKRHIKRRLQGKAFLYTATVPKLTLLQTMMQRLASVFAGGSHQGLVAQLIETGDLSAQDLKLLKRVASSSPASPSQSSSSPSLSSSTSKRKRS